MGNGNAMFKHIEGYMNEVFLRELQEPRGHAGQDENEEGRRDERDPPFFSAGEKKEEE